MDGSSFYISFRPILFFAQVSALMPLRGIFGNNPEKLRFTWTNPWNVYGVLVTAITLVFSVIFTNGNLKQKISIDTFGSTVFYTVCLLTTVLFLSVARRLPEISRDFLNIETCMVEYGKPKRLRLRVALLLTVFVVLAIVEHGTMGVLHFNRALDAAKNGTEDFGRVFYEMHFGWFAATVPYPGVVIMMILTWTNAVCTFNWNFLDFFLMGISMEVAAKFDQITDRLIASEDEKENYEFWVKIYTDYGRIVLLTKKLDRIISGIVLTSFCSTLYHLSLQLLRSLRISGTIFHKIYFYFSLSYLILRLLSTLFFLSNVHEAGRRPIDFLFSLDKHCTASLRLLEQILTDDIHFTGSRIFIINRSFVVSIIGTIITYQVVLLQFNSLSFVDA